MNFLPQRSQMVKLFSAFAAVFLVLLLTPLAQAQVDPQGVRRDPNRPLTDAERQRKLDRDLENREHDMRMLEAGRIEVAPPPMSPATKLRMLIAEIQKGTEQLQVNNGKLQQTIKAPGLPDYRRIAGYASEIRKAVTRLQTSLVMPKSELKEAKLGPQAGAPDEQLKTSILSLDQLIKVFVTSEILQRPAAVDAQLFTKAGQDLTEMLRQSTKVKRIADELRDK